MLHEQKQSVIQISKRHIYYCQLVNMLCRIYEELKINKHENSTKLHKTVVTIERNNRIFPVYSQS